MSLDNPLVFFGLYTILAMGAGIVLRNRIVVYSAIAVFAVWLILVITILALTKGGASG